MLVWLVHKRVFILRLHVSLLLVLMHGSCWCRFWFFETCLYWGCTEGSCWCLPGLSCKCYCRTQLDVLYDEDVVCILFMVFSFLLSSMHMWAREAMMDGRLWRFVFDIVWWTCYGQLSAFVAVEYTLRTPQFGGEIIYENSFSCYLGCFVGFSDEGAGGHACTFLWSTLAMEY